MDVKHSFRIRSLLTLPTRVVYLEMPGAIVDMGLHLQHQLPTLSSVFMPRSVTFSSARTCFLKIISQCD